MKFMDDNSALRSIAGQFAISGKLSSIAPLKRGHINDTYLSIWAAGPATLRYIHQKINRHVFRNVPGLMRNVELVTAHIQKKLSAVSDQGLAQEDQVLKLVPTKDGRNFYQDEQGEFWRTYVSIENCLSYDLCPSGQVAFEAARACARFDKMLMDLDSSKLIETIPDFHNAAARFRSFNKAIERDEFERVADCQSEIEFARTRVDAASQISAGLQKGLLPCYSVHNDTKLNNILFSKTSGRGIAIVDLDTCMAGTLLYDFGDLTKHLVIIGQEDEQNLSKIEINLEYFSGAVDGYLSELLPLMKASELELLAKSLKTFALILGTRFLSDHLQGDTYFKISRPGHNIERARAQFKLVLELEEHESAMEQIVDASIKKYK
jgi:hypothetical protein